MPNNLAVINLARTRSAIDEGIANGWHRGLQLHISRGGEVIADWAIGEARPGVAITTDSLLLWMSAGKPVTTVAILQLSERGLLDIDTPVARYLPDFEAGGKESITIRHMLTHTGGFRLVHIGWPESNWNEIIRRICEVELESRWEIGETLGYHTYSSWYILGELVKRFDGRGISQYAREEIFEPLEMPDSWLGMPQDVYRDYGDRIVGLKNTSGTGRPDHKWDSEEGATHPAPGGNTRGPVRDLARFYRMLLAGGQLDGTRILEPKTVREMTRLQVESRFDKTFRHQMAWGLGLMMNSYRKDDNAPYGFGRYASRRTFGHGGNQSSIAFCDPLHDLVVAWVANGMPGEEAHQQRNLALNEAIYLDLGLSG